MTIICERGFGAILFPCVITDWKIDRYGYGWRYVKGSCRVTYEPERKVRWKQERAHIVALEEKLGRSRAEGMQANHHCDNRACVRWEHLYEGTQLQNIGDMNDRKRGYHAFADGILGTPRCVSPEKEDIIRKEYLAGNITQRQLAEKYQISKASVNRIVRNRIPHKPRRRLSAEERETIRRYAEDGVVQKDLAEAYDISSATISNVITRRFKDPLS